MTDHDGDDEIRAEHHEVVKMGDVKSKARRNEQKIPEKRDERGEKQRRPAAQPCGGENNGEQIEKRDSPIAGVTEYRQAENGDARRDAKGDTKVTPRGACESFLKSFSCRRHRLLCRDHVDVDVATITHEPAQRVASQKACPSRAQRLADNNLSDVVFTGDTEQRFADIATGG